MNDNVIALIKQKESSFSKGQRRIADFIINEYDKAAFMTAHKLGEKTDVSESTVVRFAMELGFNGYPHMQKAMQKMIRNKLTTLQRIEVTRSNFDKDDVLSSVMSYDVANVRQTLAGLSNDSFSKSVDTIVSAKCVYVIGLGSCRALGIFLANYLKLLLIDVRLVSATSEAEIFEELLNLNEDDVVIAFSFPRYSTRAVKAMHFAHSRGTKIIAITDSESAPFAHYATHLLLAHSDMATIVDSLVAPMSVINALVVAISLRKEEKITERLYELEKLWEEYDVYQTLPEGMEV